MRRQPARHRRRTAAARRRPGAHLGRQRLVGGRPGQRPRGAARHRGLLRGAGPLAVRHRQRRHGGGLQQAGRPGLRADLARHAAEEDRLRRRAAAVHQRDQLLRPARGRCRQMGPAAVAEPVQHPDHAPRVPVRRRDPGLRVPAQRRAAQRRCRPRGGRACGSGSACRTASGSCSTRRPGGTTSTTHPAGTGSTSGSIWSVPGSSWGTITSCCSAAITTWPTTSRRAAGPASPSTSPATRTSQSCSWSATCW